MFAGIVGRFSSIGIVHPREDAEALLAHVTPLWDAPLANHPDRARLVELVERRASGEPLAYLLGRWTFRSLQLVVDARVLIPRAATDALVEVALAVQREVAWPAPRIADICTGSGAIAGIALAVELPASRIVAVDLSEGALDVARQNVARFASRGVPGRVDVRHGDLLGPLGDERFEMIVSNPPYGPTAVVDRGPPELHREPRAALDGGADGLELVRRLVDGAPARLVDGGLLAIEHDVGQDAAVGALLGTAGFRARGISTRDAGNVLRVTSGRRARR